MSGKGKSRYISRSRERMDLVDGITGSTHI